MVKKVMVDINALLTGSVGVGAAFFAVILVVIMFSEMQNSNIAVIRVSDNRSAVAEVLGNSTSALGSIVTTWGTIIILGIVILSVFIAILAGLMFLVRRSGR